MGCGKSAPVAEPARDDSIRSDTRKCSSTSRCSNASNASELSSEQSKKAHDRLRKLLELDKSTKVPFILVELRGEGPGNSFIEICGKDEYGVYEHLDHWLTSEWSCTKLDSGDLDDSTPVPFSDALYKWGCFKTQGDEGMSNMGLASIRLIDYMANSLGWTLGVINGGNVGKMGEIREQQIIFKAPHPMNLVAPHCMIELRSAGYIEVCGDGCGVLDDLDTFLEENFKAMRIQGHEDFCDRFYKCGDNVFKERGNMGENNMGLLTTKVCDFMGRLPGWNLVTMNGGNYGEKGTHREQQLVFRWDNHPLQDQPHLIVELRGSGYVEVNGEDVDGIYSKLDSWLKDKWRCSEAHGRLGQEPYCDKKYKWTPRDMMVCTAEMTSFFHDQGWQMQVCSQGTVKVAGQSDSREQQMLFRPGMSGRGIVEPHLFIELYTGEGTEELYARPDKTQVLGNQFIRMFPIGDCNSTIKQFHQFLIDYLGGMPATDRYYVDCFLGRGLTDNNLGCWTMRVCDFMVDRLGWSFVVCNVCNLGPSGEYREQQLVFRYDGEQREIPVSNVAVLNNSSPSSFKGMALPSYWKIPEVCSFQKLQDMIPCEQEETEALQDIMDRTFKRVLTRDRVYEYQATTSEEMPYRLELVHAFRSENLLLCKRYIDRRTRYRGGTPLVAKTREGGGFVNCRLQDGEALLYHGTNPSSSISILKTGFVLNHAGKSTGSMFGYGVYLAECCSKSDEYAKDDSGGNYPGLRALLVCRCLVGNPYVVQKAGDHIKAARDDGCDCVLGDRESVVNTYREFVFFDEAQILPEYAVIYKRVYDKSLVPGAMVRTVTGTTGRNWQVKLEKGWANIPAEPNRQLIEALKRGQNVIEVEIGTFTYVFDLAARQQTNKSTGNVRQLRPPMFGS